jgi:CheY-like chemotaxis protein
MLPSLHGLAVRLQVAQSLAYYLVEGREGLMAERDTETVSFSGLQDDDPYIFAHEDAGPGFTEREHERAISVELHLLRFFQPEELILFGAALVGHADLPFRRADKPPTAHTVCAGWTHLPPGGAASPRCRSSAASKPPVDGCNAYPMNPIRLPSVLLPMRQPSASVPVVLVVEDEGLVRLMAVDLLEDEGFTVIEAATADEAWTILETRDDIAILFTDVEMPGSMNGLDLAGRVAARWPHIRLVITSGRVRLSNQAVPDHGQFVPKPYYSAQLLSAFGHARPAVTNQMT